MQRSERSEAADAVRDATLTCLAAGHVTPQLEIVRSRYLTP